MAIQPVTLQAAINQGTQMAPLQRQAEVAAQTSQATLGQQFAEMVVERSETVQQTLPASGNRVENDLERHLSWGNRGRSRTKRPFASIEASIENQVAPGGEHLIDVTA